MNVAIQIERLVLEGLELGPGQAALLRTAVEAELTQLLAEGRLAPDLLAGAALPALRGAAIQLGAEISVPALGRQIAQAVYSSVGASHHPTPSPRSAGR